MGEPGFRPGVSIYISYGKAPIHDGYEKSTSCSLNAAETHPALRRVVAEGRGYRTIVMETGFGTGYFSQTAAGDFTG